MNASIEAAKKFEAKFDLVGPTVDHDIRRAITRYGADAVKEAVKRATKPKRGRKPEDDWLQLREIIEADARNWLAGGDPFSTRSNYSIAKEVADKNPGHSHPATMKRIEGKLRKNRKSRTLAIAHQLSWEGYPYSAHVRACEALIKLDTHPVWVSIVETVKSQLADYEAKFGEPPPSDMSMKEVEDAGRNALLTLISPRKPGGLAGMFSSSTPNTGSQE